MRARSHEGSGDQRALITAAAVLGSLTLVALALMILYATLDGQLHAAVDDGLRDRLQHVTASAAAGPPRLDDAVATP